MPYNLGKWDIYNEFFTIVLNYYCKHNDFSDITAIIKWEQTFKVTILINFSKSKLKVIIINYFCEKEILSYANNMKCFKFFVDSFEINLAFNFLNQFHNNHFHFFFKYILQLLLKDLRHKTLHLYFFFQELYLLLEWFR